MKRREIIERLGQPDEIDKTLGPANRRVLKR